MTDALDDADADPLDGRSETLTQRSDRNWLEILQELRVTQTGTQILTGFLLTLPFQAGFASVDAYERGVYLVLISLSVVATALGLAPVLAHRLLFRRRLKARIVALGDVLLRTTLAVVAVVLIGTVHFVFDVVVGGPASIVSAAAAALLLVGVWVALPLGARRIQRAEALGRRHR